MSSSARARRYRSLSSFLALLARFGVAGLANTGLGFAIIETLDLGFHLQPAIANACGYAVGMGLGFVLNRGFVFQYHGHNGAGVRYLAVVLLAFVVNQAVLAAAHPVLGPAPLMRTAAQLAGMGTYTILTFILCRYWVFQQKGSPDSQAVADGATP